MRDRFILGAAALWSASFALAAWGGVGCSSSSSTATPLPLGCDGSACADSGHAGDTGAASGDSGSGEQPDAEALDAEHPDAHDSAAPDALYGACAVSGSFGWPCTAATTGPDPTDCTDPTYPDCFVGGQGSWCTKACPAGASDCVAMEDAGCVPTACNARGYCK